MKHVNVLKILALGVIQQVKDDNMGKFPPLCISVIVEAYSNIFEEPTRLPLF
jgi:hypothetical protein